MLFGQRCLRLALVVFIPAVMVVAAGCAEPTPSVEPQPPTAAPAGKVWGLAFDAEFEGTSLDLTKFSPCFDWNYGNCTSSFNEGKEHYLPSQVQIKDGVAKLVAEPLDPPFSDTTCLNGTCTYKSGLLSTARPDQSSAYLFPFTYGYVEARMKLPAIPGMFSAFWMLPIDPTYQNYDYEIDIVENVGGKPNVIYQSYYYDGRNQSYKVNTIAHDADGFEDEMVKDANGKCAKMDYSADFHNYGVNWQPDHIAFYIDGTECGRFTSSAPGQIPDKPMQIIIDLMVDTNWQRDAKLVLPSQAAVDELEVDYVKVWQAK